MAGTDISGRNKTSHRYVCQGKACSDGLRLKRDESVWRVCKDQFRTAMSYSPPQINGFPLLPERRLSLKDYRDFLPPDVEFSLCVMMLEPCIYVRVAKSPTPLADTDQQEAMNK